jgi:hypothetical protein
VQGEEAMTTKDEPFVTRWLEQRFLDAEAR